MSYNWQKHVRGRGGGRRGGGGGGRRGGYYDDNNDYDMDNSRRGGGGGHHGGRGGGGGGHGGGYDEYDDYEDADYNYSRNSKYTDSASNLRRKLESFENKPWNFYKDLRFIEWKFKNFSLWFDRVQTDPFAPPTNLRVRVPMRVAAIPADLYSNGIRNVACCDYLTRQFGRVCKDEGYDRAAKNRGNWHGKKGGDLSINMPGQHVIERSSVKVTNDYVEVRFTCSLPGRGRRIEGFWCADIMLGKIPDVVERSLLMKALQPRRHEFEEHVVSVEDQEYLRRNVLDKMGLCAFVPNGSILPRRSGVDDRPMARDQAVAFECSPQDPMYTELQVNINNNDRKLAGLGIPKGITLIVGGGFHGKSTLLEALQYGVYNHIPGDGREFVVCLSNAVKIRAEDGRSIVNVNISPFINNLPHKKSTSNFYTSDASGSTSQAANICEAVEIGCNLLLIDEDTCATNFMIRDRNMQLLVSSKKEPITPFISKIRAMYKQMDVSSILVVGGCGAYFQVADHVVMMDNYLPRNLTQRAKEIANSSEFRQNSGIVNNANSGHTPGQMDNMGRDESKDGGNLIFEYDEFGEVSERYPVPASIDARGNKGMIKMKIGDKFKIGFGRHDIDLSSVAQVVEKGQSKAVAKALIYLAQIVCKNGNRNICMREAMNELENTVLNGLDGLNNVKNAMYQGELSHDLVRPRTYEIAAALNRLRSLKMNTYDKGADGRRGRNENNSHYATNSNYTTTDVIMEPSQQQPHQQQRGPDSSGRNDPNSRNNGNVGDSGANSGNMQGMGNVGNVGNTGNMDRMDDMNDLDDVSNVTPGNGSSGGAAYQTSGGGSAGGFRPHAQVQHVPQPQHQAHPAHQTHQTHQTRQEQPPHEPRDSREQREQRAQQVHHQQRQPHQVQHQPHHPPHQTHHHAHQQWERKPPQQIQARQREQMQQVPQAPHGSHAPHASHASHALHGSHVSHPSQPPQAPHSGHHGPPGPPGPQRPPLPQKPPQPHHPSHGSYASRAQGQNQRPPQGYTASRGQRGYGGY